MRGAMGNALLLNIIVVFVLIIVIFFSSVLAYSKAYRAKNRVVELIEKYGYYSESIEPEIIKSLGSMGYQLGDCQLKSDNKIKNKTGYKYCVEEIKIDKSSSGPKYYRVTTYVQFYFPVIGEFFSPAVTSETKILGTNYNY